MQTNYIQVGCYVYIFDTNRIIKNTGFVPVMLKFNLN